MKLFRSIFDDWLTRVAAIILIIIIALVLFNVYSTLPLSHPLFGVLDYSLVPVLFVAGGVIFILAIFKYLRR